MSTSSKARMRWAAAVLAVAFLVASALPAESLTVRHLRGAGLVWAVRTAPGERLTLRWTHTVTLRPVEEEYEVGDDRRLHLRQLIFDQYGPNLPAGPEGGTVWRVEQDRWVVTGYNIALERLSLGLSHIDHRLIVGDRTLDLIRATEPNGQVVLQVEQVPLIQIIATEVYQWLYSSRRP